MLRYMKRYTYRMGIRFAQSYLDIYFFIPDIFAKDPHFALIAESIGNRPFRIIGECEIIYDFHTLMWRNADFDKAVLVLLPIVSETDAEDFDLYTKILQKLFNFLSGNHVAKLINIYL